MSTMVDLERACRAAGMPTETVPDFLTNGHDGVLLLTNPDHGYWHHTDARVLQSVYYDPQGRAGWPASEWRPTVPAPRANVYGARARAAGCRPGCRFTGKAHLVFTSAGKAHHAGFSVRARNDLAARGGVSVDLPDAGWSGLADDYAAAGFRAVGFEVDWASGEGWPADLLDLVAAASAVTVRVFGWPGPGCWIHHRQATGRKPDMAYRGDLWSRTQQALDGGDDMSAADVAEIGAKLDKIYSLLAKGDDPVPQTGNTHPDNLRTVRTLLERLTVVVGAQADDEAHILAAVQANQQALVDAKQVILGAVQAGVDPAQLERVVETALSNLTATTTLATKATP